MDSEELGWMGKLQAFGTAEAAQWNVRLGRCDSLAKALWGRNSEDLRNQLQKPHPEIPLGFELTDFLLLLRESSRLASLDLSDPKNAWIRPKLLHAGTIRIGAQQLTEWEARAEIVRRAIDHLKSQ